MRIKVALADFSVEELLAPRLGTAGRYAILRVEKRGIATDRVQAELAAMLGIGRSAVRFPALKDRRSVAVQYASVVGNPPPRLKGGRFSAVPAGRLDRPLRPTDIEGNRFTLTLRDLDADAPPRISSRLRGMAEEGFPKVKSEL